MLAGPGAMSTAILLHNQAEGFIQRLGLYVAIVRGFIGFLRHSSDRGEIDQTR